MPAATAASGGQWVWCGRELSAVWQLREPGLAVTVSPEGAGPICMAATVAGRLVTAFPTQDCSTATFYGVLAEELSRIQSALGSVERSNDGVVPGYGSAEHQVGPATTRMGRAKLQTRALFLLERLTVSHRSSGQERGPSPC